MRVSILILEAMPIECVVALIYDKLAVPSDYELALKDCLAWSWRNRRKRVSGGFAHAGVWILQSLKHSRERNFSFPA
jgi:hypothetical protein